MKKQSLKIKQMITPIGPIVRNLFDNDTFWKIQEFFYEDHLIDMFNTIAAEEDNYISWMYMRFYFSGGKVGTKKSSK